MLTTATLVSTAELLHDPAHWSGSISWGWNEGRLCSHEVDLSYGRARICKVHRRVRMHLPLVTEERRGRGETCRWGIGIEYHGGDH